MAHDPISRWENEGGAVLHAAGEPDRRTPAERHGETRPPGPLRPDKADTVGPRHPPRPSGRAGRLVL
jgi:hypothetical protein